MESENKIHVSTDEAVFVIVSLLQLANDGCVTLYNLPDVNTSEGRSYRLEALTGFNDLNKKLNRNIGKEKFVAYSDLVCGTCDDVANYYNIIYMKFFESCVTKYQYQQCDMLSHTLTVSLLLNGAQEWCKKLTGCKSAVIDGLINRYNLSISKLKVRALNENIDIETKGAYGALDLLASKLIDNYRKLD